MRSVSILAAGALLLAGLSTCSSVQSTTGEQDLLRVGIFDSRAVAVAYARSEINKRLVNDLVARHARAEAEGNAELARELEAEGEAHQDRLHRQGFGTASVQDLLEHVQGELPAIAEEAGVDLLVSRWDVVYVRPGVQLRDVTEEVLRPFHPDATALAIVRDLVTREPVPLAEIEKMGHDE